MRRASEYKNSTPITSHGMYFPSTPLPSLLSPLLPEKDVVGWYRLVKHDAWRKTVNGGN